MIDKRCDNGIHRRLGNSVTFSNSHRFARRDDEMVARALIQKFDLAAPACRYRTQVSRAEMVRVLVRNPDVRDLLEVRQTGRGRSDQRPAAVERRSRQPRIGKDRDVIHFQHERSVVDPTYHRRRYDVVCGCDPRAAALRNVQRHDT